MSNSLKNKHEKIFKLLEKLIDESAKGTPIFVEGRKDLEALRILGIIGPVHTAKTGGKSFDEAISQVEKTGARKIILLFDFDRRGKEATSYFKRNLEKLKISPNLTFWKRLSALTGREIQCIESLSSFMDSLQRKIL